MMVVGGFLMMIIFALIFGLILKFLWNSTVAELFALPTIGYWQAIGLFILAKFFFGFGHGMGFQHQYNREYHKQWHGRKSAGERTPDDDETLQKYWEEEGKAAYESFLTARQQGRKGEPEG